MASIFNGDREAAMEAFDGALRAGAIIPLHLDFLQNLYEDPVFMAMLERESVQMDVERSKFLQAVCVDKIYASAWQPEPEICEKFWVKLQTQPTGI